MCHKIYPMNALKAQTYCIELCDFSKNNTIKRHVEKPK